MYANFRVPRSLLVMFTSVFAKIGFYLLSMVFFLIIVLFLGTDIPVYFGRDWKFAGYEVLCSKGVLIPIICSLLLLYVALFLYRLNHANKGTRLGPIKVVQVANIHTEIMSFVASYFFPLVSFDNSAKWKHLVVLFGLFVLIGCIYIKSNIYYCNPTLSIMGYHVYNVKGNNSNISLDVVVITRDTLREGDSFKYISIDNTTWFGFKC